MTEFYNTVKADLDQYNSQFNTVHIGKQSDDEDQPRRKQPTDLDNPEDKNVFE